VGPVPPVIACAKECPININQPAIILDMRRYLVMEEGSAPAPLKSMLSYIENNGAPWQYLLMTGCCGQKTLK